jgi:hypothetical protein
VRCLLNGVHLIYKTPKKKKESEYLLCATQTAESEPHFLNAHVLLKEKVHNEAEEPWPVEMDPGHSQVLLSPTAVFLRLPHPRPLLRLVRNVRSKTWERVVGPPTAQKSGAFLFS